MLGRYHIYILSITACVADDVEYDNGDTWTSANDPCETCVCEEGITYIFYLLQLV